MAVPSGSHGVAVMSLGQYQQCGQATSVQGQGQSGGGRRDGSRHVRPGQRSGLYEGRAGFPLGRSPFFLPALVCAATPLGDARRREGLAGTLLVLVLKFCRGEQQRL